MNLVAQLECKHAQAEARLQLARSVSRWLGCFSHHCGDAGICGLIVYRLGTIAHPIDRLVTVIRKLELEVVLHLEMSMLVKQASVDVHVFVAGSIPRAEAFSHPPRAQASTQPQSCSGLGQQCLRKRTGEIGSVRQQLRLGGWAVASED